MLTRHAQRLIVMTGLLSLLTTNAYAVSEGATANSTAMERCLLERLETAPPNTTVGQLRNQCTTLLDDVTNGQASEEPGVPMTPVQERLFEAKINFERPNAVSLFKPNYFIATYTDNPNEEPFRELNDGRGILDNEEAKFQVSFKVPLWRNVLGTNNDLIGAYTSVSWWQINNDDISEAFRETNYEPEVFLRHYDGPKILGGQVAAMDIGINHQSNGRSQPLSRSWNRIMGRAYLDFDDVAVQLRGWYRIPESREDDDNPNEYRYLGYGDVLVAWAPNKNTFTAMVRPGTEEFGTEFTWSYPINGLFRVYAQYWNGYGESLLDYDTRVQRIGIGIAINDYIQRR